MNESSESLISASNKLIYISNAGVLIQLKDRKILIDGLCRSNNPIYKDPSPEIAQKIKGGIPPFNDLDLMLITHEHSDHFDPVSVDEFSKNNPGTVILSTPNVITKLRTYDSMEMDKEQANLIEFNLNLHQEETLNFQGMKIRIISLAHMGKNQEETQNYAYLIEYGLKLLHVGDADAVSENYNQLNLVPQKIDYLIAPFPYISIPSARRVIKDYINPQKIAVLHFPHKELDHFGWIKATRKSFANVKEAFIKTNFLEELGTTLIL
ncbi:MBL fold metallo-hydrolase [Desulfitobacterium sp. Sab5]|uniref:MBL fold metallo-hydrolase n=1 Tax=Desulfitobacterium nosdiversum TaxID=3375356 RepID=UPI003CEEED10